MVALPAVTKFSSGEPGMQLPGGWRNWTVSRFKKSTEYRLVKLDGRTVIKAQADDSASGLVHDVDVDPKQFPVLRWRWKVTQLIAGADNTRRRSEDSPVRLIVTFNGDRSKWDLFDRIFATQLRMLTGHELPYATLMYIWENRVAAGTVLPNLHTSRIKMIVAQSGERGVGEWCEESRDVFEDYRRAFGEEPSRVSAVAIMTDTDNTGANVHAYYGDIAFQKPAK